jgi:hypothetical protein
METVEVEALVQAVVIEDRRVHHVVIDGDAAAAIRLAAMTGQWVGERRLVPAAQGGGVPGGAAGGRGDGARASRALIGRSAEPPRARGVVGSGCTKGA